MKSGIRNLKLKLLPSAILLLCFVLLILTSFIVISLPQNSFGLDNTNVSKTGSCVNYKNQVNLIQIFCKSAHLTDIALQLNNTKILGRENPVKNNFQTGSIANAVGSSKTWILNSGIEIEKKATLVIDSSDTDWLKIVATPTTQLKPNATQGANNPNLGIYEVKSFNASRQGEPIEIDIKQTTTPALDEKTIIVSKNNGDSPNGIHVHGSLKIDSVKITSWDPDTNDVVNFKLGKRLGEEHTKSDYDTAEPRGFIRVAKDATGTTNITNSEIAYLGYSCSRCSGISYYGGEGSIIGGSNIHHLLKGFYSKGMGNMTIQNNSFHDNYLYGVDPHTGSHHMLIKNNIVYNNNASGIICSKDCHSLIIEGNKVYNNTGAGRGISFSINTTNSVARNNYVYDNRRCIAFNRESNFNEVYNNTLLNCKTAVYVSGTSNNLIRDNKIVNASSGIVIKNITNQIYNNDISSSDNGIVFINEPSANTTNKVTEVLLQDDYGHLNNALTKMGYKNSISDTNDSTVIMTAKVNDTDSQGLDTGDQ